MSVVSAPKDAPSRRFVQTVVVPIVLFAAAWALSLLCVREIHLWVAALFGLAAAVSVVPGDTVSIVLTLVVHSLGLNLFLHLYGRDTALVPTILATVALVTAVAFIGWANQRRRTAQRRIEQVCDELTAVTAELLSQQEDLGRFHELSLQLSSGIGLDVMLKKVIRAVTSIQHTDMGILLLPGPDRTRLRVRAHCGFTEEQVTSFGEFPASFFPERRCKVIEDIEVAGVYFPFMSAATSAGFRSISSTPVATAKGETLGIVVVFFPFAHSPSERESKLAELYARQAANCIENARMFGRLLDTVTAEQQRIAVLRSLSTASIKINSSLSLDDLLQTITDEARTIVGAQQAYTTFIPKGQWTQSINCISLDQGVLAPGRPPNDSEWFMFACQLNKPLRITTGDQADRAWWSLMRNSPEQQVVDGWLAVPLLTRDGRNLGLIQLSQKLTGDFTADDEAILVQIAQIASVAIENVRLYREAQEQIQEKTRAQEALQRSKESMQLAQHAVGIGIWEWDLQRGNLSWSEEICRLHGVSPDAFDGTFVGWMNTIHPEDREAVLKEVSQALARGTDYQVQYRIMLGEGEDRWVEARGQIFSVGATPIRALSVGMDVSLRKKAEEALRKSEKLVTAGRLAATIAHEINNPLAAVTNLLYLLRSNAHLDDTSTEYLRSAEAELSRVVHIAKQTLAFHRELSSPVEANIPELIDEVLAIYREKADALGLSINKQFGRVKALLGYPNELRQVFSNLLLNAFEASPVNSTMTVRVREYVDSTEARGIRISIADHGSGIAAGSRSRIFEPFFTTKQGKGTGLGLWVSGGIVQTHGGKIRVRSRVEGATGTCISILLPYNGAKSLRSLAAEGAVAA